MTEAQLKALIRFIDERIRYQSWKDQYPDTILPVEPYTVKPAEGSRGNTLLAKLSEEVLFIAFNIGEVCTIHGLKRPCDACHEKVPEPPGTGLNDPTL